MSKTVRGTKREAEDAFARLLVETGTNGGAAPTRATFGDLLDRWTELAAPGWSPSTVQVNRTFIETYIRPALGRRPIRRLTVDELDRFYTELREHGSVSGQPLAPRTVRRIHNIVHRALEPAVRWSWITVNPASRATPPKLGRLDPQPPAPADVARLLAAAEERDPEFALFLRVAAATGARRGELCGLRWNRVDFAGGALLIDRSIVEAAEGLVEKDTKTHQARRVALDTTTVELLEQHRQRCLERAAVAKVPYAADAYVFSLAVDGTQPLTPHAVSRHFSRLCQRLGLEGVRLHDLRHYVATRLIAAGVPVRTVSGRLGHTSAATTLSVYSHFVEATDQDAARLLGLLLDDAATA